MWYSFHKFFIRSYEDNIWCDIVSTEGCHIILGWPWQFDKIKAMPNDGTNEITFIYNENKFVLHHLSPS